MSLDQRGRRLGVTALMCLVVTGVYLASAAIAGALHDAIPLIPRTRWDAAVPFLPWTIIPYATLGLLTLVPAWFADASTFRRMLVASALALLGSAVCFILYPHAIERPPADQAGAWAMIFTALHAIDPARNTCPSLHVVFAVLVPLALRSWWTCLWGAAVAASALTTGQHALVDAAGGIVLALAAWWTTGAIMRRGLRAGGDASPDRDPAPGV